jgi:hypothetical protein
MNNFYDPQKTFLELVVDYKGDLDDAFNLFQDAWSDGVDAKAENRTFSQAIGIDNIELAQFIIDKISIEDLLKRRVKLAASTS